MWSRTGLSESAPSTWKVSQTGVLTFPEEDTEVGSSIDFESRSDPKDQWFDAIIFRKKKTQ